MITTLSTYEQREIRIKALQVLIDQTNEKIEQKKEQVKELQKRLKEIDQ